jgi:hypothetical protein
MVWSPVACAILKGEAWQRSDLQVHDLPQLLPHKHPTDLGRLSSDGKIDLDHSSLHHACIKQATMAAPAMSKVSPCPSIWCWSSVLSASNCRLCTALYVCFPSLLCHRIRRLMFFISSDVLLCHACAFPLICLWILHFWARKMTLYTITSAILTREKSNHEIEAKQQPPLEQG